MAPLFSVRLMPMIQRLAQLGLFLLFVAFTKTAKSQYELMLIDRPRILADSVSLGPEFFEYRKPGQHKMRSMERDKLFAIWHPGGREEVVYLPDSSEGNWFSAEQMHDYLEGQEDARRCYKHRANRGAIIGVFVGAGGSISRLYGSVLIAAYPGLVGAMKPSFSPRHGYNPLMKENVFYREGFGTMAKRMSTRRAFWATLSGYVAGTVVFSFVFR